MRDVGTVLDEIGAKWNTMSTLEQNQLAYVVAGTRQRNVFIAAMEDYNRVLDATTVSENANGTAAEKMTIYTQTLEAAQNNLTSSIQQFAQDSNLDQILITAYNGLAKVVEILNILLNKIPVLSPLIKALGVALAAAFGAKMITSIKAVTSAVSSIGAAASSATAILTTTAVTIGSFAVPVWGIVAAITAIAGAVKLVVKTLKDNTPEQKAERSKKALEESNAELDETNSKIQEVKKQIDDINSKGTLTLADEAEKQRLQEQLDLLEEIKKTQEAINKEKSAQALSDEQAKAKKMTTYSSEDVSQYQTGLQSTQNYATAISTGNINELIAAYQQLEKEKKNLNSADEDYAEQLKTNEQLTSSFTTKLLEQKQSYLDEMKALSDLGDTSSETYKALQQAVDMINVTLDPSNFETLKVQNLIDTSGLEDKIKESVQAGDEAGDKMATAYAKSFAKKIQDDDSMKNAWAQAMAVDPSVLDNVDVLTKEIYAKFQQMYGNISDGYNEVVQNVFSKTDVVNAYATILDKVNDKNKILTKAYKQLTKQGSLSTDVVQKLTEAYPELSKQLDFTSGKITLNVEVLKKLYNAEYESAEATVKAEIEKTKATIEGVRARISALEKERQALLKTLDAGVESGRDEAFYEKQYRLLEASGTTANANLSEAESHLDNLNALLGLVQNTARTGLGSGVKDSAFGSKSSGKSAAQKAAEEAAKKFESEVKQNIKNLKGIVTKYSQEDLWDDQAIIDKAITNYNTILDKIVNNPEALKIAADALGVDLDLYETQSEKVDAVTKALKAQAGTIEETHQKLAKEDAQAHQKELQAIKEAAEAEQQAYEDAMSNIQTLEDMVEGMLEKAIDLLEKAGSFLFEQIGKISNIYDKQIDNLDKISDELDKQKDDFEEKIDKQKEMLKLQKEEMDNADELAEKNKSIADIDAQLMELQYDNSAEAQAKRLKLLDERAQKEKDLSDWQKDQAYDTKVSALDKEKADYEKTIETEKKAIEAQKEALQKVQETFENTLSKIQSGFNSIISVLNNDVVKRLATKAIISVGGDNLKQALYIYNKIWGDGLDATVDKTWSYAQKSMTSLGWSLGQYIGDYEDLASRGIWNLQQQIDETSEGLTKIGTIIKNLEAGKFDMSKSFNLGGFKTEDYINVVKNLSDSFTDYKKTALANVSSVSDGIKKSIVQTGQRVADLFNGISKSSTGVVAGTSKGIGKIVQGAVSGIQSIFNTSNGAMQRLATSGISSMNLIGTSGKGILSGLANTAVGLLQNISGVAGNVVQIAFKGISGMFSGIGNVFGGVASGISSIFGIGGASSGIGLAGVGTALSGALPAIAAGGAIAGAAGLGVFGGITAIKKNIELWKDKDKSAGKKILGTIGNILWYSSPIGAITSLFQGVAGLFKKHHTGADYVKKQNPMLDKMLGLGSDETVSILKVGEAVVPTWANGATSSGSNNKFTGSPFGSAVDSAVKSARAISGASYTTNNAPVMDISMPINIQGDADSATIAALKKEADNIVNKVMKTINGQTRIGGYRNIKAATV